MEPTLFLNYDFWMICIVLICAHVNFACYTLIQVNKDVLYQILVFTFGSWPENPDNKES